MQIIAHRGLWHSEEQKNTLGAFRDSLMNGFGIETDVRDQSGELVISHDVPSEKAPLFSDFLKLYSEFGKSLPLAINIKADGLQKLLKKHLSHHPGLNYFLFDMSFPETVAYLKNGMNIFTRQSEYEPVSGLYQESSGVWMDCFNGEWFTKESIINHIQKGKTVCLVSPEIHKRPHLELWESLKKWDLATQERFIICTDQPKICREFFNG